MDKRCHYTKVVPWNGKPWQAWQTFQPEWEREIDRLLGRTRSMSGWTAERLGVPDAEWLGIAALDSAKGGRQISAV